MRTSGVQEFRIASLLTWHTLGFNMGQDFSENRFPWGKLLKVFLFIVVGLVVAALLLVGVCMASFRGH